MVRREKPTGQKEREKREERERLTGKERKRKREREKRERERRKQGEDRQRERETQREGGSPWSVTVRYQPMPDLGTQHDHTVTIQDQCGHDISQGARGDPCCFGPRGRPEWYALIPNRQGWGRWCDTPGAGAINEKRGLHVMSNCAGLHNLYTGTTLSQLSYS